MIRYILLNGVWVALTWLAIRRLRPDYNLTALILSFVALYVMMVIFNTYLTSLPIVEYNPAYIIGLKIISWPIEDIAYLIVAGMLAPALYTTLLKYYESTHNTAKSSPTPSSHHSQATPQRPNRSRRRS